jgi:hypothetical protein
MPQREDSLTWSRPARAILRCQQAGGDAPRQRVSDERKCQEEIGGGIDTETGKDNVMSKIFSAKGLLLGAVIVSSVGIGYAIGAQPHMEASLSLLRGARAELAAATPNKGGHRARALGLIDQAIAEIRDGIVFAGN